jgi:hypothetical protein
MMTKGHITGLRAARGAGAAVLVAAACGLAGCGSSGGQSASSSSTSSSPAPAADSSTAATSAAATSAATTAAATSTASSSTSASSPPPSAATAKLTPPGTTLHAGQTAIVKYDTVLNNGNDGPSYKLALTIQSITPGSLSDFKGITLTGVPKGATPTYVKLRMTNLGQLMKTGSNDPADGIGAIHGNSLDGDLILTGFFPHCPLADTPNPFRSGQSFVTCETFMEQGGVTKVGYNGSESTVDSPIIWTK